MIDFEQASMRAIKDVLPTTHLKGCYFHFQQALFRKIQEYELTYYFLKPDSCTRKLFKKIAGLAFVPESRLDEAYSIIWKETELVESLQLCPILNEKVSKFKTYFENQWFEEFGSRVERGMWNQYENLGRRTNNNLEGLSTKFTFKI